MTLTRWEGVRVVGTTTVVAHDDLPAPLVPLYRDADGRYLLPAEGDTEGEVTFDHVGEAWVEEQRQRGEVQIFDAQLPARSGHVLWRTNMMAPEYLPVGDVRDRLAACAVQALRDAARELRTGNRKTAEERLWYASRAAPKKPLAFMALRALLRSEIPPSQLAYLEQDIAEFSVRQQEDALAVMDESLRPILDLVRGDVARARTVSGAPSTRPMRPSYLENFENFSNFFAQVRPLVAAPLACEA